MEILGNITKLQNELQSRDDELTRSEKKWSSKWQRKLMKMKRLSRKRSLVQVDSPQRAIRTKERNFLSKDPTRQSSPSG
jgi:hypothetical protein